MKKQAVIGLTALTIVVGNFTMCTTQPTSQPQSVTPDTLEAFKVNETSKHS